MFSKNKSILVSKMRRWTDGSKYVLAHNNAPEDVKEMADFVGTNNELVKWVLDHPYRYAAVYVVTCGDPINTMRILRPTFEYVYIPTCS